mmetsp:Transcript_42686/g.87262  ORF Transcript_42686/g.87262 Transcript_42686/m.87262 type:complete len:165 (+) Transcript_42686:182-676(+)|eukprot:CAMPEP_0181288568 /NCGR_PEP_ID=MMETSP1101-20121128/403_1 /TAXON_ID=46948 /ORGANISM="Rhodomonas abbreviata, Strain Caron Lab Isolate" /LENGTH=164 /DNA_ID=CAMNT_0023392701 /DNA_START=175 /DNA_END=669 /DNA_ORIENTATION=+
MSAAVHPDSGTCRVTKRTLESAADRKSLPTQVHVRPSHINCNSLRSEYELTKFRPSVLIGNWNEQRIYDTVNTVDPTPKSVATHYHKVESLYYDSKCPPTFAGVRPRYETENGSMFSYIAKKNLILPAVETVKDPLGKPLYADVDEGMYSTSSGCIGDGTQVRF